VENDIWYSVDIEWECAISKLRIKFNGGEWSDWVVNKDNTTDPITRVDFQFNPHQEFDYYYIDWISGSSEIPSCSLEHCDLCDDYFECQYVGCCWYYQPWWPPPFDNYCGECEGECNTENCGLCTTEETCEAVGCYWFGEYCSFWAQECGDELACQFCLTEETCEAEGCHWNLYSQTCWYEAPVLPYLSWLDYYDEHGGYDEPLSFINNLALTSDDTFANTTALLEGFTISFNTADALARGSALGNVIPKGRGYLKVF
ncbi:unnamed protein product, partial [marine sediment metagenome]